MRRMQGKDVGKYLKTRISFNVLKKDGRQRSIGRIKKD